MEYKKYENPFPIQDQAIPYILQNRDLVGIANTGTGKTGAFLIPLINKVFSNRNEKVLIIIPTRKLAFQIDEEFNDFSYGMKIFLHFVLVEQIFEDKFTICEEIQIL